MTDTAPLSENDLSTTCHRYNSFYSCISVDDYLLTPTPLTILREYAAKYNGLLRDHVTTFLMGPLNYKSRHQIQI